MSAFFSNAIVQLILYATFAYMLLLWFAAAYWAFRDMRDRTENPVLPFLATGLIIMFLPFFFPLGIVVYRVIGRPNGLARFTSETWPKKPFWPKWRQSRPAAAAIGAWIPSGSSARGAADGSTGSVPTARGWSAWIGPCARGAAKISRSPPPSASPKRIPQPLNRQF